ncbi:MAG: single-stranded DNA-binding protein [Chloroflexota bacterium]
MYQKIIIVGNLGRDPEMRYMPNSGDPVTTFSVAVNEYAKDESGNRKDSTLWFRVSVFGKQAENANLYLKKGRRVLVEGKLSFDSATGGPRVWQRQDGTNSSSFEIRASIFQILSPKTESDGSASGFDSDDSANNGEPPF